MQEAIQSEDEISLSDIFRALWAKVWLLIAALVAGVALGGAFGFVRYHNIHYYGAEVQYFITAQTDTSGSGQISTGNQYNETVFITISSLLKSETFNQLLIKDLDTEGKIKFPQSEGFTEEDGKTYDKLLKTLTKSLSYSYNFKASQIKVSVSVLNDEQLAKNLLKAVESHVPEFIQSRMSNPSTQTGKVTCEVLTYNRALLLNEGQTVKEMMKFGLIAGLAAAVIACAVVIIVDRMDNRLRDYEDIPVKFALPVLGVIPRIDTAEQMAHSGYGYGKSRSNNETEATK